MSAKRLKRIFVDLDDVLNNFTPHILRYLGCRNATYKSYPRACGFDLVKSANALLRVERFTPESLWSSIPQSVWREAPKSPECDDLLELCAQTVGRENVCVLTTPTTDPTSLAGKLEWIHAKLPAWMHRQFLIGPCKQLCASPDCLLIDDAQHNLDEFARQGGQVIPFPRPWNNAYETVYRMSPLPCHFFSKPNEPLPFIRERLAAL
jgi:5'(3')-deoxyribonucleotidase